MKNILGVLLLLFVLTSSSAQVSLTVTVENIKELKGSIRVGLFTSEKDFLKKASEGHVVKATAKSVTVVFSGLKPGDYAVSVIHDENENEDLDTNIFGIPKEGFAFGNNAMGTFGPPSWEKAKVTLTTDGKQTIRVRYF